MKKLLFYVMFITVLINNFIGCKNDNSDNRFVFDEKKFILNRNAWFNNNINNYSFTLTENYSRYFNAMGITDPYSYEFKIVVNNSIMDSFESAIYNNEEKIEWNDKIYPPFNSITDIYQRIFDYAQEEKQNRKNNYNPGYSLFTQYIIEYNSEWNYITFFDVNYDNWDLIPMGAPNFSFRVSDFEILN